MNDIIIPPDPRLAFMGTALQTRHSAHFVRNSVHGITLLTKTQGGVGADTFASLLAYVLEEQGAPSPPIFQAGGTKGLLCDACQGSQFKRVPLAGQIGPQLDHQLAQFLAENAVGPAIVVISPEANELALGILRTISKRGLPIPLHNIHLARPPFANLTMAEKLSPLCRSSAVAMVKPLIQQERHDNVLLIPRLPEVLIQSMEGNRWSFRTAWEHADFGLKLAEDERIERFMAKLAQFYG
jgi:hypothetical protein